ncbi:MAG TPA: DUF4032 domain-containing protein [Roseiflexaceae bacterium]|nr:DUF4032 domain-containing protein [Roseiflexaceae bacterium]
MDILTIERAAREDFREARRKALIGVLLDTFHRRPSDLLSFEDVRRRLHVRGQRYLGHQVVPVSHVVGSEGRYTDFDRRFLPRTDAVQHRWSSIDSAMIRAVELPPVELYKIGDAYFVRDGNHRISVARQQGQTYIDAYVTELLVDVPLTPDTSVQDLMLKEEYSDFLEWTDLHQLRPDERIEFSELGGYLDLVKHINAHRYFMGLEQQREIGRDEAVASWYDHVYLPIIQVIREHDVLRHFPDRTEADLYRWVMDHRWYTRERTGADPGPEDATSQYVELFGRRRIPDLLPDLGDALRAAVQRLGLRV